MYTLEKLSVEEGKHSAVNRGYQRSSNRLAIFLFGEHELKEIDSIHQIKVGYQVYIGRGFSFLQTSPIAEILKREDNCVEFKTQTSIYRLSKTEDN